MPPSGKPDLLAHEVIVSGAVTSQAIGRLVQAGQLRQIAPRLYK